MIVKGAYFRNGKSRINGKGVGAVLLDGGQGGQSSYESPADWMATIKRGGSIASTFSDIQDHLATGEPFRNGTHKRPPMSVDWIAHNALGMGIPQGSPKHNALGMGIPQPAPTIMPVRPPAMRRPVGLGAHQIARISSLMMKSSSPKPKAIHFSL
jgi:hypothetical protein